MTLLDAAGNVVGATTTGEDGAYAFADLTGGQRWSRMPRGARRPVRSSSTVGTQRRGRPCGSRSTRAVIAG
ncbi:hypothetical protein [Sphaerisporangium perillae]|uniref:hypothetical protein n=1 Tax=Sphaerisporangium perillae TaxID=2935860 RepID=UPI002010501A|nr:hypothetical protein [Sphaerisporangium perillae]